MAGVLILCICGFIGLALAGAFGRPRIVRRVEVIEVTEVLGGESAPCTCTCCQNKTCDKTPPDLSGD